jgi:SAM domain (Sterile alpha motif)
MEQIAGWLKKLGMSEYTDRFVENHIDEGIIRELTDQDLKVGVVSLGHHRKMLRAIRDLSGDSIDATAPDREDRAYSVR